MYTKKINKMAILAVMIGVGRIIHGRLVVSPK
jgi:hypothetical protein